MSETRETILISRLFAGEATPAELQELEELVAKDQEAAARFRVLKQFWEQHEIANSLDVEAGLQKVLTELELPIETNTTPANHRIPRWLKISAAAMIIGVIGLVV